VAGGQGDQFGRIFDYLAIFLLLGEFFTIGRIFDYWANFLLLGEGLHWAVLLKLYVEALQIFGLLFSIAPVMY
jgi:hypothetical protein